MCVLAASHEAYSERTRAWYLPEAAGKEGNHLLLMQKWTLMVQFLTHAHGVYVRAERI